MESFTLNIRGTLRSFSHPLVMGILNVTPDSFYAASRTIADSRKAVDDVHKPAVAAAAARLVAEGADIIDVGGYSTRPGAEDVSETEEWRRVSMGISAVKALGRDVLISVDTFRAEVARRSIDAGADIINDISAGQLDSNMMAVVACARVPYIMMHMRGTPRDMTRRTDYPASEGGVVATVARELQQSVAQAEQAGIADIIIDPGFGFAKTPEQNYVLLRSLDALRSFFPGRPVLVGMSRKSMIYRPLGLTPADCLPGTDALNALALERGAQILRVHDVAAAWQVARVVDMTFNSAGCV